MTRVPYPDELALLEEERDFLLRSLDDLDRQHLDGDLDDADYERLRDDYTARAAAVIRTIRDGVDARPEPTSASRARHVVVILGIAVFATAAAVLLMRSMGERLPGETASGNDQARPADLATLRQAVADRPQDAGAHLSYARALMREGRAADALKEFDAVARLDPADGESRAYGGWIVFLAGLPDDALPRLDDAVKAAPDYPDGWLFRGTVLLRAGRAADAVPDLERYLELAGDGPMSTDARQVLEEARRQAAGGSSTTTAQNPDGTSTTKIEGATP